MLMVPNLLATAPLLHSSLTPGVFLNPPQKSVTPYILKYPETRSPGTTGETTTRVCRTCSVCPTLA